MSQVEIPLSRIARSTPASKQEAVVMPGARRVGIATLGCKVNAYESELIGEALQTDHWQLVDKREPADLYLINTCTVTREADRQARQEVRKAVATNPEALVVVTGCYAQIDPEACAAIPGVDLVLGNDLKLDVHKLLPQLEEGELPKVMVGDLDQHVSLPDQLLAGYEAYTRAFVQIQQGCDQGCTFCIIHVARGPSRSLPPSLIKRQVQRLVLNGYPEIVICGVDLGAYGQDFDAAADSFALTDLLRELLALEFEPGNPFRIRLSSIDPAHITDELIELMAQEPRLCPHIHLSLQSGNTMILKRMKRRYDANFVRQRIFALRQAMPELIMSADVMVGFPTETQAQFEDSLQMVKDLDIVYPHVFSYSERTGTPAAKIPQSRQVPIVERKQRNQQLREIGEQLQDAMLKRQLGSECWVLPESGPARDGLVLCRSEQYVPVLVAADQIKTGQWQRVTIKSIMDRKLVAA